MYECVYVTLDLNLVFIELLLLLQMSLQPLGRGMSLSQFLLQLLRKNPNGFNCMGLHFKHQHVHKG